VVAMGDFQQPLNEDRVRGKKPDGGFGIPGHNSTFRGDVAISTIAARAELSSFALNAPDAISHTRRPPDVQRAGPAHSPVRSNPALHPFGSCPSTPVGGHDGGRSERALQVGPTYLLSQGRRPLAVVLGCLQQPARRFRPTPGARSKSAGRCRVPDHHLNRPDLPNLHPSRSCAANARLQQ
jgi:hypothetical protein